MRQPPRKKLGAATGPRRLRGEVLDVAGAAELLGASEKLVRARAARGLLPYRRWGGRVVFLREEISMFLSALPGVTAEQAAAHAEALGEGIGVAQ